MLRIRPANPHTPVVLGAILIGLSIGCAPFSFDSTIDSQDVRADKSNPLPAARISGESLMVDTSFVPLATSEEGVELWNNVDESLLDSGLRQRLNGNGLRLGRLLGSAMDRFKVLDQASSPETMLPIDALENVGIASELSHVSRRLHCRPYQPYRLPTRAPRQTDRILMLRENDGIKGLTLDSPDCSFEVSVASRFDQRLTLKLRPVIEHGQRRQSWIGQDHSLRLENKREQLSLGYLHLELDCSAGDVIAIGATEPAVGLGQLMFDGRRADGIRDQTVLLIRVLGSMELTVASTIEKY